MAGRRAFAVALTICSLAVVAQIPPSAPSPPHEKLTMYEGAWTVEGDTRQLRETCAWLPEGRRHMVCRSRWMTATGAREGMSLFSYVEGEGYVYYGMRASGAIERLQGRLDGDRWVWSGESAVAAKRMRSRATITPEGPDAFRFVEEVAEGDGPWKTETTVRYVRAR